MTRRRGKPESIANSIGSMAEIMGDERAGAALAWRQVVGEQVARSSMPVQLKDDGELVVRCASSAWTCEIQNIAPTLIARLRERPGCESVTRIKAETGTISWPDEQPAPAPSAPERPFSEDQISAATNEIDDPEIKASVERAMRAVGNVTNS